MGKVFGENATLKDSYGFEVEFTPMDEMRVVEPVRLVGSTFVDTTLDANFWTATLSNATATPANNQLPIATTSNAAGSSAVVQSVRSARYVGGSGNRFRAIIRMDNAGLAGNTRQWGCFTSTDGAYFELSGTTFNVVTRKTNTPTPVASTAWNGKKKVMDTNVHSYEIYFTNSKVYFVMDGDIVHTVTASSATWTDTTNFPVRLTNVNDADIAAVSMNVRVATIYRLGKLQTAPITKYISGAVTNQIYKRGPGMIHGVLVGETGTLLTFYDSLTTFDATTTIASIDTSALNAFSLGDLGIPFYTGLAVTTTGAGTRVTIIYE